MKKQNTEVKATRKITENRRTWAKIAKEHSGDTMNPQSMSFTKSGRITGFNDNPIEELLYGNYYYED